jgi:hypothetical protein
MHHLIDLYLGVSQSWLHTFGSRVIGDKAYDTAVREERGGATSFGVRVVGAIKGDGPVANAKRATQHGPLVVDGAQQTDTKAQPGRGRSIDELNMLDPENPTSPCSTRCTRASWRAAGPRDEALRIFREVERGIKGEGRREISTTSPNCSARRV